MKETDGWSRDMWRQYVDLGLTALPFAEEHGGVGGGPVETMIVMEAFGRALALEPYLATVVLGGGFLRRGASDAVKSDVLPKVAAGETLLAFAHTERQSRYDLADVATTAKKDGAGYVLDGAEEPRAARRRRRQADRFGARLRRAARRRTASACSSSTPKRRGVSRRGYPTMDGLRAAEVTLHNVKVDADAVHRRAGQRLSADRAGGRFRHRGARAPRRSAR